MNEDDENGIPALLDALRQRLATSAGLPETVLMGKSTHTMDAVESAFFYRQLEVAQAELYVPPYEPGMFSRQRFDERSEGRSISMREIDCGA